MKTRLAFVLLALTAACAHAQADPQKDIHAFDWTSYFNKQYAECLESVPDRKAVELEPILYHDFDGDGREEALVTGSSCNTGTAGPDIHSVFRLDADGTLAELKFSDDATGAKVTGIPLPLIGNRNWRMTVKQGRLCNQFSDGSGATTEDSRVSLAKEACYAFTGGQFVLTAIAYAPTFETSFDCRKARTDREIVACRNPEAAKLDVELAKEYRALLRARPEAERPALIAAQKAWLRELDEWAAYKWVDEVIERYSKRIQALRSNAAPRAGATPERGRR